MVKDYKSRLFELSLNKGNLSFGSFTLKSGRVSPYFFNAGGFDDGASLGELARCYAVAITNFGLNFDMLFGPAYKGIPLAAATAVALNEYHQRNVPYAFNRKEAKDHGEGGTIVGAPLCGKVLVIDAAVMGQMLGIICHAIATYLTHKAGNATVAVTLDPLVDGSSTDAHFSSNGDYRTPILKYSSPHIAQWRTVV